MRINSGLKQLSVKAPTLWEKSEEGGTFLISRVEWSHWKVKPSNKNNNEIKNAVT